MNSRRKTQLLILGSGTFAAEAEDIAQTIGHYQIMGFVESLYRERCRQRLRDLPIYWIENLPPDVQHYRAIGAMVSVKRKSFIKRVAKLGLSFEILCHPAAVVSSRTQIGAGTLINAGAVISQNTRIGEHVIINRGCLIGHDNEIGSFVTISPGANIAGCVRIESGTFIGMGAVILDHLTIGEGAVVAAGALVTKDAPPGATVIGRPARIRKAARTPKP